MDYTFPDKYVHVARYFDHYIGGDLEKTSKLTNEHKLMFYALRMQAEEGPCRTQAPAFWHITERYKHQAWAKLGNMSKFEAMVFFVKQFEQILTAGNNPAATAGTGDAAREICWRDKMKELPAAEGSSSTVGTSSAADENGLDDDLKAHCEPTAENIAYLVAEVTRARQQLREALAACNCPPSTAVGPANAPSSSNGGQRHSLSCRICGPAVVRRGRGSCPTEPPMRPEVLRARHHVLQDEVAPPLRPEVAQCCVASVESSPPRLSLQAMAAPQIPTKTATGSWVEWLGW